MIPAKKIGIGLILLIIVKPAFAQEGLVNGFYHHFDVPGERVSYKSITTSDNEAKLVASFLFLFYKEFISSQDMEVCVFTPSCSSYAMESIKEYGLLKGLLNALDRITRCHPLATGYYPVHPETHKYYDPIK